jgi:acyl-CoA synthetase (NDP forming)/RimJ/RimL family protein N-acetyltransferase
MLGRMDPADLPPDYPREWEADVVLADGQVAHVRPIVPADADALQAFHMAQSEESIYLRFFAPMPRLSERDLHRFTHVDYHERVALVMTIRDQIVGVGRYDRLEGPDGPTAEVAFNVSDRHQGRGIGSVLLEHLAAIGRDAGVRRFVADVLPQNRRMIAVFADAGYEVTHKFDDGVISVSFDIEPTEASDEVRMSREHRSEARSVRRVLTPRVVAVVGVGRDPQSIGRALYRHIREAGFTGELYAVNPRGGEVDGIPLLPRLTDAPQPIDLAVIATPPEAVLDVVRDAADAGAAAVVVVSSGFAEAGSQGERRQAELLRLARSLGMRVLGPSSFGFINTDPEIRINASLSPRMPARGRLGLFAQSGALGIAVLASAERRGLGISTFASAGNRVDISGNDLMQYWIDDEATAAVGLYLESVGNPRKFTRIARQLSTVKPVMVVKSGVGAYGVPGHRVRTTRERPEAFAAMMRQSGVIRVENTHQLFDVAQLVVTQPLPRGPRVAVVTNSDALGALAAAACQPWRLEVTHGPVAVHPESTAEQFGSALSQALADERVDSVIACFVPPLVTDDTEVVAHVGRAAEGHEKPVVATFLGMRGVTPGAGVPAYPMPEDAVRALAHATHYAQWRGRNRGQRVRPENVNRRRAHDLIETVLHDAPAGRDLTAGESADLLAGYGVDLWPAEPVTSAEEAVAAAERIGLPVVVKATDPLVRHQPGLLWVRSHLHTPQDVAQAYESLAEALERLGVEGIAVQAMAPAGVAVEVTSTEDPLFGPVVAFGVAGLPVDLLGDVAHGFPPLTDVDVADMIASVRAAPMLNGYRGAPPVDLAALHDLVARISVLADDLPEVAALRLNPVMAHPDGVAVLGAEIRVTQSPLRTDQGRRALLS